MNDFLNQDNNDGDKSSLILLKGEAGIGKSFAILFKYRQQQHQRQVDILVTVSNAMDENCPYASWRGIILGILRRMELVDPAEIANYVIQ